MRDVSQIKPRKHGSCQHQWDWKSPGSQTGVCMADTVVCGRGHQQIKRSQTLMALPFYSDTLPYVLSERHMQQWHYFSLPKQLRQYCSLRPYAVPEASKSPPMFVSVGTRGRLKGLSGNHSLNMSWRKFFFFFGFWFLLQGVKQDGW